MNSTRLEVRSWYRITLDHGENFKRTLLEWARGNDVRLAWLQCLGELENATVASGYAGADPSGDKHMKTLRDNHHVMGMGTLIRDQDGERVHLHGPMGRDGETTTGCWAENPDTFRGMDCLVAVLEEE